MTFDSTVMGSRSPQPPKQLKEQKTLARKQDSQLYGQTDKQAERPEKQPTDRHMDRHGEEEENEKDKRPFINHHVVEVDIEINISDNGHVSGGQNTLSHPAKCSKQKACISKRERRKPCAHVPVADVPSPFPGDNTPTNNLPSSPSLASVISETAVEELCDLRHYYNNQLRRINYISHEYLGQHTEPGVLACIREPLRSLRLPRGLAITQTARSLWTRVSGRRKLVQR